jgi:MEDS: MEthanogen/methylotroph, DcmR Sensory domain
MIDNNNTQPNLQCYAEEMSSELRKSEIGSHFLIQYPDLPTFREMYSYYIKSALYGGNEIVVILPFYETADTVRRILSEDPAHIDVREYEKEQRLLIIDSLKGYFGSADGLMPFVNQTVDFANSSGRNSVTVIGDMGSFFYYQKKDDLVGWEMKLPRTFEMNLKGFCLYDERDFNRLSEKDRQRLSRHHAKTLQILPSPIG